MQRRRALLLRPLDEMVQRFLMTTRNRGEIVSRIIAKPLIVQNSQYNLVHIYLNTSASAKSLSKRMGLSKRMSTTDKIEISAGAKKKGVKLLFMHKIVALVEEHNISPNLIMNLDHTHQSIICRGYPSICIGTTQLVTITTSSSTYDHGCVPGQMTADVSDIVRVHNIYFGNVSTKMTHLMIY